MHAPTTLTLPQLLLLYRYDQGLTCTEMAREARLCPHCYELLEAGRGVLSRQALESLYVRLPVIAALMTELTIPLTPEAARALNRLRIQILALERLDAETQAIELMRVRLALSWTEPSQPAGAPASDRFVGETAEGPTT